MQSGVSRTLFIVPLSVVVRIREELALRSFVRNGVSKWEIWWHRHALTQAIQNLRLGKISLEKFKHYCDGWFPAVERMGLERFKACWSDMCDITSTYQRLMEIEDLKKQGYVCIIGEIDKWQIQNANHKLASAHPTCKIPERDFSYEQGKHFPTLLKEIVKQANLQGFTIRYFLEPPPESPYSWLGSFRWLFFPLHSWCYERLADEQRAVLHEMSSTGNLSLITLNKGDPLPEIEVDGFNSNLTYAQPILSVYKSPNQRERGEVEKTSQSQGNDTNKSYSIRYL